MDQICSMCPYSSKSQEELIAHLVKRHKHCPQFIIHCSAIGCGASFKKHSSFRSHCHRKHFNYDTAACAADVDQHDDPINIDVVQESDDDLKDEAAFILKLTAQHKMSQHAISDVLQCTRELLDSKMLRAKDKLSKSLPADQQHIFNGDCFNTKSLFDQIDTEYKQEKYFQAHFNYTAPQPVVIGQYGEKQTSHGAGKVSNNDVFGYIVPFLPTLTALLSMPEVQECLQSSRDTELMTDFYDGLYFSQHEYLKRHPKCLCFGLYTDDFEVVNPIGSHRKKHKITAFYWTLLNIPVEHRSKLSVIQLVALAKTSDLKAHGCDKLLKDLCDGLQVVYDYGIIGGFEN